MSGRDDRRAFLRKAGLGLGTVAGISGLSGEASGGWFHRRRRVACQPAPRYPAPCVPSTKTRWMCPYQLMGSTPAGGGVTYYYYSYAECNVNPPYPAYSKTLTHMKSSNCANGVYTDCDQLKLLETPYPSPQQPGDPLGGAIPRASMLKSPAEKSRHFHRYDRNVRLRKETFDNTRQPFFFNTVESGPIQTTIYVLTDPNNSNKKYYFATAIRPFLVNGTPANGEPPAFNCGFGVEINGIPTGQPSEPIGIQNVDEHGPHEANPFWFVFRKNATYFHILTYNPIKLHSAEVNPVVAPSR